jgi:hypothetical protein
VTATFLIPRPRATFATERREQVIAVGIGSTGNGRVLLARWHAQVSADLFTGASLNLDFHSVPYFGEHPLVESLGPDVPLHFTAFHPDYKMLNLPRTPASRGSRR